MSKGRIEIETEANPSEVRCLVKASRRTFDRPTFAVFDGITEIFQDFMAKAGLVGGPFELIPIKPIPGTPELGRQGIVQTRFDPDGTSIVVKAQWGGNDKAWQMRVKIPRGLSAHQIIAALEKPRTE